MFDVAIYRENIGDRDTTWDSECWTWVNAGDAQCPVILRNVSTDFLYSDANFSSLQLSNKTVNPLVHVIYVYRQTKWIEIHFN